MKIEIESQVETKHGTANNTMSQPAVRAQTMELTSVTGHLISLHALEIPGLSIPARELS